MATLSHSLSFTEIDPEWTVGESDMKILNCIVQSLEASGKDQKEVPKPISQWRDVSVSPNLLYMIVDLFDHALDC